MHMGQNAREQGAMGYKCPGAGSMGGGKQRNLGSMATERIKYGLASEEQRGNFTAPQSAGAGSRGLPFAEPHYNWH